MNGGLRVAYRASPEGHASVSHTTALVLVESNADLADRTNAMRGITDAATVLWGTGELAHMLNPDMPWNETRQAPSSRCRPLWRAARADT